MWSIIVPVFNEEESLAELAQRVAGVAAQEQSDYELLLVDEAVQSLIHSEAGEQSIEKAIRARTPSIAEDGLNKVRAGVTSIEEVLRVTRDS